MDMWQKSTNIEAQDDIEDLKHLKVNAEYKAKQLEVNRKAHSSPSKSMRRTSDLFGENSQVKTLLKSFYQLR
jgi:hypothetical protein